MNATSYAKTGSQMLDEMSAEAHSQDAGIITIDLDEVDGYTDDPNLGFDPQVGGKLKSSDTAWLNSL